MNKARQAYANYKRRKILLSLFFVIILLAVGCYSLYLGSARLGLGQILDSLSRQSSAMNEVIIWNIRLPRILAAMIAGIGLALSGCVMQCVLRNPLAAPFTMGVSQSAAFGAAFAIIALGPSNMHAASVVSCAFLASLVAVFIILMLAKFAGLSPQATVLAGIAIGTFFGAGTMLLQYFAEDVKVASVLFWTFGDVGRAAWTDIIIMAFVTLFAFVFFFANRQEYNILEAGEETAKGLGINAERLRLTGILMSSLVTSVCVAFLGIIGFIGLIAPHMARRIVGSDHRYLIPVSAIFGAGLLLAADTISRTIMSPAILPVGIATSFMGVPLFIYLIWKKRRLY